MTKEYHVAFSFAGEERDYVDEVANALKDKDVAIFYDLFEQVDLWGKNLYTHLSDVYRNKAHFTVMFISEHYARKLWTNHEREAAQSRAFEESKEYVLPARFDDTDIPGVLPTVGYISLEHYTPAEFAEMVYEKLLQSGVFGDPNIAPPEPVLNMTLAQYEENIRKEISEAETKLKTAHDAEKAELLQKIEELRRRAANPEAALAEAQETIRKLEDALAREGNEIGEARMADARGALEQGDFTLAREIFEEIEAREQLAVERAARAAYALGEIAEQEVRWADAATHYIRTAQLNATALNISKAQAFTQRSGDYAQSLYWGEQLVPVAIREYGEGSKNHATSLNNLAGLYEAQGKYDAAEPLYLQAIEIDKKTLGEAHPDYATSLNNLAGLYRVQGEYDAAEPLYLQATEIDKKTLGEAHPNYAIRLNNLAGLYEAQGKYDAAEPLYLQAIEIFEKALGNDHPNTQTVKANYDHFLKTRK